MTSQTQQKAAAPREVADSTMVKEADPPKARAAEQRFRPALTIGVLSSRWLRSYATPCHARGASL